MSVDDGDALHGAALVQVERVGEDAHHLVVGALRRGVQVLQDGFTGRVGADDHHVAADQRQAPDPLRHALGAEAGEHQQHGLWQVPVEEEPAHALTG